MYKIPEDFKLTEFIGLEISLVTFAEFSVYINFGDDNVLTILHSYILDGLEWEVPPSQSALMSLLGLRVTAASFTENESLILSFSNGKVLVAVNPNNNFESYSIILNGREIIV